MTKAELQVMHDELKTNYARLVLENEELKAKSIKPSAPVVNNRIAISADNPVFEGLPVYQPHIRIKCDTHGPTNANKAGFCIKCCMDRIRPVAQ